MDQVLFSKEISELSVVLFRLNRSFWQLKAPDPEELRGLSGTQMQTLSILKNNKRLNMTELAEYMIMARQQLTKTIDVLVSKGLVIRGTDPDNRRHVMIELSEKGDRLVNELVDSKTKSISEALATLDDEDAFRMLESLRTIREVLSKYKNE